jgi:hypothetical protein
MYISISLNIDLYIFKTKFDVRIFTIADLLFLFDD